MEDTLDSKSGASAQWRVGSNPTSGMTHVYYIKKWGSDRFKEKCRILCRGRNGNLLLEFEDGYQMVTIRYGVRKVKNNG